MDRLTRLRIFSPKAYTDHQDVLIDKFVNAALRLDHKQLESLRIEFKRTGDATTLDKSIMVEQVMLVAKYFKYVYESAVSATRQAMDHVKVSHQFAYGATTPAIEWYVKYVLKIVGYHQEDILRQVKGVILLGMEAGLTEPMMAKELGKVLDVSKRRLNNIARNETARLTEIGRHQICEQEPMIVGYEICALIDERTSPICAERNGSVIPKGENYPVPPYHHSCRTTLLPVFDWEVGKDVKWRPIPATAPAMTPGFGRPTLEI